MVGPVGRILGGTCLARHLEAQSVEIVEVAHNAPHSLVDGIPVVFGKGDASGDLG